MSDKQACDDHDSWKARCEYCRGLQNGKRTAGSDPHCEDYCIICDKGPRKDVTMYPILTENHTYICAVCVEDKIKGVVGK